MFVFADDLAFLCKSHRVVSTTCDEIQNWCDENKTDVNSDKSGVMRILNRYKPFS